MQAEQYYQKSLVIYIEFNDQYEQASIYHLLGMVAEAQEQWQQAYEYYLKTLAIDIDITHTSLRRLWQAHPVEDMLPALAQALGMTVAAVLVWIVTAD